MRAEEKKSKSGILKLGLLRRALYFIHCLVEGGGMIRMLWLLHASYHFVTCNNNNYLIIYRKIM